MQPSAAFEALSVGSLQRQAGFTLPELVATLVVVGILAAVAVPRFMDRTGFDVFGYSESVREALRFAQKSAIAKRRQVCVTIASNALSTTLAPTFGGNCDSTYHLNDPSTGKAFAVASVSGISVTAASFYFDALGRPSAGQTLSVTGGSSSQTITVEAETGYVH